MLGGFGTGGTASSSTLSVVRRAPSVNSSREATYSGSVLRIFTSGENTGGALVTSIWGPPPRVPGEGEFEPGRFFPRVSSFG